MVKKTGGNGGMLGKSMGGMGNMFGGLGKSNSPAKGGMLGIP
jgi:hypothetical protein